MNNESKLHLPSLKSEINDYVTSAVKALLGAVPFAGSLLAEIAGTIIPNQRIERLTKYAIELENHLSKLDQDFVRAQLSNENFTDLFEENIRQAARSLTDERRRYLASIIANGLTSENIEFFESKHLLRILGEINDAEVIILRSYLVATIEGDRDFREKHEEIIMPEPAYIGAPQRVLDKDSLHQSYQEHLTSLGLFKRQYQTDIRTKGMVIDTFDGGPKLQGYRITSLGCLLLRHIGLANEEDQPINQPETD
jgi:hypothetical protein